MKSVEEIDGYVRELGRTANAAGRGRNFAEKYMEIGGSKFFH